LSKNRPGARAHVAAADGRVVVRAHSPGATRVKNIAGPHRPITAGRDSIATADFLNRHYSGWTLEAIRADLLQKLATERERYEDIVQSALSLCDRRFMGDESSLHVTSKVPPRSSAPQNLRTRPIARSARRHWLACTLT